MIAAIYYIFNERGCYKKNRSLRSFFRGEKSALLPTLQGSLRKVGNSNVWSEVVAPNDSGHSDHSLHDRLDRLQ